MPFTFIAGGLTAIGIATTAAGVAAAVSTIATVATVAGIGMTVIGAATGNKDLMEIGGYVGLAGGVASLASGAFLGTGLFAKEGLLGGLVSHADDAAMAAGGSAASSVGSAVQGAIPAAGAEVGNTMGSVAGSLSNTAGLGSQTAGGLLSQASSSITPSFSSGVTQGLGSVADFGGTHLAASSALPTFSQLAASPASQATLFNAANNAIPSMGAEVGNTFASGAGAAAKTGFWADLMKPAVLLPAAMTVGGRMMDSVDKEAQAQYELDKQGFNLDYLKKQNDAQRNNMNWIPSAPKLKFG